MYVVLNPEFDPEINSVWGPFMTASEAEKWRARQPDQYRLVIEQLADPEDKGQE